MVPIACISAVQEFLNMVLMSGKMKPMEVVLGRNNEIGLIVAAKVWNRKQHCSFVVLNNQSRF